MFLRTLAITLAILAPTALGQGVLHTTIGTSGHTGYGSAVAALGDVNHDGINDYAASVKFTDLSTGHVMIVSGADGSTITILDGQPNDYLGSSLASPGDVTGDGIPDLAVGSTNGGGHWGVGFVRLYSGADWQPVWMVLGTLHEEHFGMSLTALPDLDHDGRNDLAAGTSVGIVKVLSGRSGAIVRQIQGSAVDKFGTVVAGLADLDGDRMPELAIAAPNANGFAGSAFVYSTRTWMPLYRLGGRFTYDWFGSAIADAGDLDGDAIHEFAIGAPGANGTQPDAGQVLIYSGATGQLVNVLLGEHFAGGLGRSLANVGDVDLDSHDDLLAGQMGWTALNSAGSVTLFSGRSGLMIEDAHASTPTSSDQFGIALAAVGDLNGDNVPDAIVGAPGAGEYGTVFAMTLMPYGTYTYGEGTRGCHGTNLALVNSVPRIDNPFFAFTGNRAPERSLGLCLVSDVQDYDGSDPLNLGIRMYVGVLPPASVVKLDASTDLDGYGVAAFPIPNDPNMVRLVFHAQLFWLWPATECNPSPFGLSSSNGVTIAIQP